MSEKIWRGGMVGAGAWSKIQLDAWADVENAEIVALCDRHPERRDPIATQYNLTHTFNDLETMLNQMELDFVDICVRPYSHAALTKLVAQQGLPILCQKPFCTTLAEAQETVAFCRETDVRLMINENYRWQAWYRKAKELIDAGAIGEPYLAKIFQRMRSTLPKAFVNNIQAYFFDMPHLALYELGVHYVDTLRFLFGNPNTIYARLHHLSPEIKGEDLQLLVLGYDNLTCFVDNSWASMQVPGIDYPEGNQTRRLLSRLEVEGTGGTLAMLNDGSLHLATDTDHQQWSFSRIDTEPQSRVAAQQHFINCLESGTPFETSGTDYLKTMALVWGGYTSAEEGRVVDPNTLLE
jgi:predicted dehydrogenase